MDNKVLQVEITAQIQDLKKKLDEAAKETSGLEKKGSKSFDNFGKAAKAAGKVVGSAAKVMGTAIKAIGAAVVAGAASLAALAESTQEYRTAQAKLETAFQSAGSTAEQATETYNDLYRVLGDNDTAVEAANHLAKLTNNQQDLSEWTNICQGVYATFGDSLPIEGLTEAANETAKVGQLTGSLADALNWAGINEEEFQAKLDACNDEAEREKLIRETLNGVYSEAADGYEETAKSILEANEAQALLNKSAAAFGAIAEPFVTQIKKLGGTILSDLVPCFEEFASGLQDVIDGVEGGEAKMEKGITDMVNVVIDTITKMLPTIVKLGVSLIKALIRGIVKALPDIVKAIADMIPEILKGILEAFQLIVAELPTIIDTILSALPELIPQIVTAIVTLITTICEKMGEIIQPIIEQLPIIIETLIVSLMENLPILIEGLITLVLAIVEATPQIILGIIEALPTIISSIISGLLECLPQIIAGLIEVTFAIVKALPQILCALVQGVINIFVGLWDGICEAFSGVGEWFSNTFSGAVDGIKNAFASVGDFFSGIWDKICNAFGSVVDWFGSVFSKAWQAVKDAFSSVGDFFSGIWRTITDTFKNIGTKIGEAVSGAFKSAVNWVLEKAVGLINGFIRGLNWVIGVINEIPGVELNRIKELNVPKMAKGGIVDSATLAVIGEQGKEAVVPLENNTEWMDKLADKLNTNKNAPSKIILMLDGKELGWASIDSINNITRQTGKLQLTLV